MNTINNTADNTVKNTTEKKITAIIREYPPESCTFSFYFDDDGFTEAGGDFCYNLFILGGRNCGNFNFDEYKKVQDKAEIIIEEFEDIAEKTNHGYSSYKEVMTDCGIVYNSRKCHALKEWAKTAETEDVDCIAEFLTILTGKEWETDSARGYYQGDYVKILYCKEHYKNGVQSYGEIWLGAAKEFAVIYLNDNGEEDYEVGGFIVADCAAKSDEDYKRLVCEWEGLDENETVLEMIDNCYTYTKYDYRSL